MIDRFRILLSAGCAIGAIGTAHAAPSVVPAAPDVAVATDTAGPPSGDDERQDIVVNGQRPVSEAASGTKSDTPLVETPQSISVIGRAELDARAVQSLNQALELTAGITPDLRGANAEIYDQFKLRGFDAPRYLDGLKVFLSPTGYADTQVDLSRVDRIEVVKGPASVLYGQSSPGGLVAFTSKLPTQAEPYGEVAATYGTYSLYRLDGDVGGALDRSGSILYRLNGSINGADTQQTFGKRRRYTVSPSIAFGAGSRTTLTLLANYTDDPYLGNYGVLPVIGTLDPNPNGRISTHRADGEPSQRFRREQASGTYLVTHDFGGSWVFRANGRYTDIKSRLRGAYTTGTPTDATLTTFDRGSYATHEFLHNWTLDNQLAGKVVTGPITHSILIGLDQQWGHAFERYGFGGATPLNMYDPVYGTFVLERDPAAYGFTGTYNVRQRQTGLYAQDQLALGGFRLTLSGRQDWARQHVVSTSSFGGDDLTKKDRKFTYRVGGLYLTDFGLAPYASYSTSFEPQSSRVQRADGTIDVADPSTGKQFEAGLKYQPPGTPILVTAAYFHIDQSGVVVSNPANPAAPATQSGKVRSTGFEVEAKVPLFRGFEVSGAYSRQKIRTIRDDNPLNLGRPLIQTGKGNASLFANYTMQDESGLAGLSFGGAVRHVDRGYGGYFTDAAGTAVTRDVYIPSYTVYDASLGYDLGKVSGRLQGVRLAVNAANLFDKKFVTSCYVNGVGWCWYGSRRTVSGTIGYRW